MNRGQLATAKQLIVVMQPLMRDDVQTVMDHADASVRDLASLLECSTGTAYSRRLEVYTCLRDAIEFVWGLNDE